MINLLPKKEKKRLKREYLIRLATLYIFFVVIVSIIALVLLAPSYYIVHLKESVLKKQAETYIDVSSGDGQSATSRALLDIRDKVLILSDKNDSTPLYEVISTILNGAGNGIKITNIAYRYVEGEGALSNLIIKGIADRRDSLREFSQYIKDYENVVDADLPVSSLAKESNIDFEINIKGIF